MKRKMLCAWLLVAAFPLQAETVYRWVDKDGVVHFGATPPPGQAAEAESLHVRSKPDTASTVAPEEKKAGQSEQERREAAERTARYKAAESRKAAERRQHCADARGIVARLEGSRNVRYPQPDGSYRMYTQDEWQAKMDAARKAERENCGS